MVKMLFFVFDTLEGQFVDQLLLFSSGMGYRPTTTVTILSTVRSTSLFERSSTQLNSLPNVPSSPQSIQKGTVYHYLLGLIFITQAKRRFYSQKLFKCLINSNTCSNKHEIVKCLQEEEMENAEIRPCSFMRKTKLVLQEKKELSWFL